MVNGLDDVLYPNCDWNTCSMNFLNRRKNIVVKNSNVIDDVEKLAEYLEITYKECEIIKENTTGGRKDEN
jgi:hypothetical protein